MIDSSIPTDKTMERRVKVVRMACDKCGTPWTQEPLPALSSSQQHVVDLVFAQWLMENYDQAKEELSRRIR